ncbi:MAG: hypothetical protein AB7Q97_03550 [Gammaproteobacteria bacterium]
MDEDEDFEKTVIIRPGSSDAPVFNARNDAPPRPAATGSGSQNPRERAQTTTQQGAARPAQRAPQPAPPAPPKSNRALIVAAIAVGVVVLAGAALLLR